MLNITYLIIIRRSELTLATVSGLDVAVIKVDDAVVVVDRGPVLFLDAGCLTQVAASDHCAVAKIRHARDQDGQECA